MATDYKLLPQLDVSSTRVQRGHQFDGVLGLAGAGRRKLLRRYELTQMATAISGGTPALGGTVHFEVLLSLYAMVLAEQQLAR